MTVTDSASRERTRFRIPRADDRVTDAIGGTYLVIDRSGKTLLLEDADGDRWSVGVERFRSDGAWRLEEDAR